ncbi:hypothetical protein VTI74DRAFT_11355 [Chaetomium olivicolor]
MPRLFDALLIPVSRRNLAPDAERWPPIDKAAQGSDKQFPACRSRHALQPVNSRLAIIVCPPRHSRHGAPTCLLRTLRPLAATIQNP